MMTKKVEKVEKKYLCEKCDYLSFKKTDYSKHLTTRKHKMMTEMMTNDDEKVEKVEKIEKIEKNEKKYFCEKCDYLTCKKTDFNKHLITYKHKMINNEVEKIEKVEKVENKYLCNECNASLSSRQSLWRHKKYCEHDKINEITDVSNNVIDKDFLLTFMKENQKFTQLLFEQFTGFMIEQNKQIIISSSKENSITNTNNNIINTNSNNNNSFNLNFFLNEQCKDAMNLSDFMDTIDVSLQDLEYVGEHGYINGITKIIIDSLNELDLYKRPIHCTDIKREVIHIKDNGIWEKDNNNEKIKRFIASIGNKNSKLVGIWQKQNPGYALLDSPKYIQWMKLAMHSNEYSKEKRNHEAILHNIVKNIYLDKNQLLCNL